MVHSPGTGRLARASPRVCAFPDLKPATVSLKTCQASTRPPGGFHEWRSVAPPCAWLHLAPC